MPLRIDDITPFFESLESKMLKMQESLTSKSEYKCVTNIHSHLQSIYGDNLMFCQMARTSVVSISPAHSPLLVIEWP